jgi:hypothetical protein
MVFKRVLDRRHNVSKGCQMEYPINAIEELANVWVIPNIHMMD